MIIERSILISASPEKVWQVFTNPEVTRQMGGEYVSDWQIGSSIGWKGKNGTLYTHGKILEIEPEKLLKHQLFSGKDEEQVLSVITYALESSQGNTILLGREELSRSLDENDAKGVQSGWDAALTAVKEIAERL